MSRLAAVGADVNSASHKDSTHVSDLEAIRADPFAISMIVVVGISIAQRGFGFLRNFGFCRLMSEGDVGQLAMALSFISLASPLFLFGIPGSLARFVEPYRRRGLLKPMIRRITIGTAILTFGSLAIIATFAESFSWLIFRDTGYEATVLAIVVALLATVLFNLGTELLNSLRKARSASVMHFMSSVGFTVMGIGWILAGGNMTGLILVYAGTTLLACIPSLVVLLPNWPRLASSGERFCNRKFLSRVAPYALSLWIIDLVSNLFDVADRYMILHISSGGAEVGQQFVGEYFGSRVMPNLLLSIGLLVSGTLMPYLTAEWESNRHRKVTLLIKRALVLMSIGFTIIGALCTLASPWLFGTLLGGRYQLAEQILPLAFMVCTWISLITVAQDYLWCAEKGRYVGIALVIGLIANVALNAFMLPRFGLYGAILATATANLLALGILFWLMSRHRYRITSSDWLSGLIPASLLVGPVFSISVCIAALLLSKQVRTCWARVIRIAESTIRNHGRAGSIMSQAGSFQKA